MLMWSLELDDQLLNKHEACAQIRAIVTLIATSVKYKKSYYKLFFSPADGGKATGLPISGFH